MHEWVYDLAAFRQPHGLAGGETNNDSEILDEAFNRSGAIICGKRMFDAADGWGDDPHSTNRSSFLLMKIGKGW